jgi:hypothetical protein
MHFEKSPPSVSDIPPAPAGTPSSFLDDEHRSASKYLSKATSYIVEEIDDDERERVAKRLKPHLDGESPREPTPDIVIEEIDEIDVQALAQKPPVPISIFGASSSGTASQSKVSGRPLFPTLRPTVPKEPSKLRFSYQADVESSSVVPTSTPAPVVSQENAPLSLAHVAEKAVGEREEKIQVPKKTPKEEALAIPKDALPTFIFPLMIPLTSASTPSHLKAMGEAKSAPKSSLPSFDFSLATLNSNAKFPQPVPPPAKAFDWGAAGIKKPAIPGGGDWTCSTCMLLNPATATDKCSICEMPR